ncbi:hypothetical protein JCM16106_11370 [Hydrogenophilus islandicus]
MNSLIDARAAAWQHEWLAVMPRRKKASSAEWEAAIAAFLRAIERLQAESPIGLWGRVRVLHRFQRWLAASSGIDKERLRPLVVAIALNHLLK